MADRRGVATTESCAQQHLLQQVWGPQYERETHYAHLHEPDRRKLEPDPSPACSSPTRHGYRFVVEER
jgi:two-component system KDP operon response regulator KdpE